MTVAMKLASNGIIPPKEWQHDKYLRDRWGNTVEFYLNRNGIDIPNEWKYDKSIFVDGYD